MDRKDGLIECIERRLKSLSQPDLEFIYGLISKLS